MNSSFTRLKIRMLFQVVLYTLLAALIGFLISRMLIDGIFQAPFAEGFIRLCHGLGMSEAAAQQLYHEIFRQNKRLLLLAGFVFLLFAFFYLAMSRITGYLNQIGNGIDQVFNEAGTPILLSDELAPLENKLNTIKNNLQQRRFEAKESQQRQRDLVVYLAHDIKTPLTSIMGYLNLLEEEKELPPHQQAHYLEIVYQKAQKLESLVDELFEVTRFNAQSLELAKRQINLIHLLHQMQEEFYPLLREKELTCQVNGPEICQLTVDPDQIARVFDNLLRNALHYSAPHTIIQIIVDDKIPLPIGSNQQAGLDLGAPVQITFTNCGTTIPAVKLERIFEKFFRGDEARSSENGGSGLGLAIAKRIVERHGGRITAASADLRTTFTVILPRGDINQ